jgi:acyl-CoA reductase-like NAD-dependent aldehyde dehydrogenase
VYWSGTRRGPKRGELPVREFKLFINGEFVDSSEDRTYCTTNPANGENIAKVHLPTKEDINTAVEAAESAFYSDEWRAMGREQRADLLLAISDKIKERKKEFISLEIEDSGSCVRKAKADIHNTASYFKVLSKQLRQFDFVEIDENASTPGFSKNTKVYHPVGVCAQIIPWNFPLVMAAWKIGPIIATGCTSVLKSAEETPGTATLLAEVLKEVGLPNGVVNIVTGGAVEGQYLIEHPKVQKIGFTGSTKVGSHIMQVAAENLKNISLELGGKSANIVCDDADLDMAVDGALYAFLYHSGQACDSGTRLFVQDGIYDEFMTKFEARIAQVKVGSPDDPSVGYGPVISEKQYRSIIDYIQTTKNEGAKLIFGGERLVGGQFDKGYYIAPTAFEISTDNTIFHEEVFGPVVGITKFKTDSDAIKMANNSKYGLAGAVWSKNADRANTIAMALEAGTVWINEYHLLNPGMPFGGFKQSGIGREMGQEGLKSYLEVKHLWTSDCDARDKKPWFDAIF